MANILVALCSFQGFGPDRTTIDAGDMVKVIDFHNSGWCNVQRLSDEAITTVPHVRRCFVSSMHTNPKCMSLI
jgi:hypothetical protein